MSKQDDRMTPRAVLPGEQYDEETTTTPKPKRFKHKTGKDLAKERREIELMFYTTTPAQDNALQDMGFGCAWVRPKTHQRSGRNEQ